jgi:nucleoid-associated protein YgaU
MRPIFKIAGAVTVFLMLLVADLPNLSGRLVPEAQALRGRGAAFAVGAAVGSSKASGAEAEAAAAQQQAAAANQQAAAAQQQAATAQAQLAAEKEKTAAAQQQAALAQQQAAVAGAPLPLGTVVSALPPGCVATPVGGVNYQYCGGNFYEPKYQGSTLVYVVAKPK